MKFTTAFIAALASSVLAISANDERKQQLQGVRKSSGLPFCHELPPCEVGNVANGTCVTVTCLNVNPVEAEMRAKTTYGFSNRMTTEMNKVRFPFVAAHTSTNTNAIKLPSRAAIEKAATELKANTQKITKDLVKFKAMDLSAKLDHLLCDNDDISGARCHNDRLFPDSEFLHKVANFVIRRFGPHFGASKAVRASYNANVNKLKAVDALAKMMQILAASYPAGEQHPETTAQWLESYRLAQSSIDATSVKLGISLGAGNGKPWVRSLI